MKKHLSILFLFLCTLAISQQKAKIGMSLEQAKKLYPKAQESRYQQEISLTIEDTLHGLVSAWGLNFKEDKLTWMMFNKYIGELSDANFKKMFESHKRYYCRLHQMVRRA